MPKGRPSFEAKSRKTSVDSSEGKLAMMAVIACSLLLPIASDDEWLFGSGREDMFGSEVDILFRTEETSWEDVCRFGLDIYHLMRITQSYAILRIRAGNPPLTIVYASDSLQRQDTELMIAAGLGNGGAYYTCCCFTIIFPVVPQWLILMELPFHFPWHHIENQLAFVFYSRPTRLVESPAERSAPVRPPWRVRIFEVSASYRVSTYKTPSQPYANPQIAPEGFCTASIHWLTTTTAVLIVRDVFEVVLAACIIRKLSQLEAQLKWPISVLTSVKTQSFYARVKAILPMGSGNFREDPKAITSPDSFGFGLTPEKSSGRGYKQKTGRSLSRNSKPFISG